MSATAYVLLGIIFWAVGYYLNIRYQATPGDACIKVPDWLYILLGAPKSKYAEKNVVAVTNIAIQITGILIVEFGLITSLNPTSEDPVLAVFVIFFGYVFGKIISWWVHRRSPYVWKEQEPLTRLQAQIQVKYPAEKVEVLFIHSAKANTPQIMLLQIVLNNPQFEIVPDAEGKLSLAKEIAGYALANYDGESDFDRYDVCFRSRRRVNWKRENYNFPVENLRQALETGLVDPP
jgi:hypothetical protein